MQRTTPEPRRNLTVGAPSIGKCGVRIDTCETLQRTVELPDAMQHLLGYRLRVETTGPNALGHLQQAHEMNVDHSAIRSNPNDRIARTSRCQGLNFTSNRIPTVRDASMFGTLA